MIRMSYGAVKMILQQLAAYRQGDLMKKFFAAVAIACGLAGVTHGAQAAGNVESASMNHMRGWACDPNFPLYQGQVMMYRDDGQWVGTAQINVAREAAVSNACGGGTIHGFDASWQVDPSLIDNKNHYVEFWYIGGQEMELTSSRRLLGFCQAVISPSGLCPTN